MIIYLLSLILLKFLLNINKYLLNINIFISKYTFLYIYFVTTSFTYYIHENDGQFVHILFNLSTYIIL